MNKHLLYTLAVAAVGLALTVLLITTRPGPAAVIVPATPAPQVDVQWVEPATHVLAVTTQGTVQPRREIDLVAEVSGRVLSVADNFAAGGFFDQAQLLVQIDEADYRFALVRAEARVADTAQLLATEKGRARQARREWRDLGNAEANALFLREPQLQSAEAAQRGAEADRDEAKLDLGRTSIAAPFNGRVRETFVDVGQYVNAGAAVARFYSTDVVEVRLPLTDSQLSLLALPLNYHGDQQGDATLEVTLSSEVAGQRWQWPGRITRTDASIDIASRVTWAVAEVSRPFDRAPDSGRPPLLVGQFVEARISGRPLENVLLLPRSALRAEQKIWIMDEQDQLQIAPVQVLYSDRSQVAVRGSFTARQRVVVSSLPVAIAGMKLTAHDMTGVTEVR